MKFSGIVIATAALSTNKVQAWGGFGELLGQLGHTVVDNVSNYFETGYDIATKCNVFDPFECGRIINNEVTDLALENKNNWDDTADIAHEVFIDPFLSEELAEQSKENLDNLQEIGDNAIVAVNNIVDEVIDVPEAIADGIVDAVVDIVDVGADIITTVILAGAELITDIVTFQDGILVKLAVIGITVHLAGPVIDGVIKMISGVDFYSIVGNVGHVVSMIANDIFNALAFGVQNVGAAIATLGNFIISNLQNGIYWLGQATFSGVQLIGDVAAFSASVLATAGQGVIAGAGAVIDAVAGAVLALPEIALYISESIPYLRDLIIGELVNIIQGVAVNVGDIASIISSATELVLNKLNQGLYVVGTAFYTGVQILGDVVAFKANALANVVGVATEAASIVVDGVINVVLDITDVFSNLLALKALVLAEVVEALARPLTDVNSAIQAISDSITTKFRENAVYKVVSAKKTVESRGNRRRREAARAIQHFDATITLEKLLSVTAKTINDDISKLQNVITTTTVQVVNSTELDEVRNNMFSVMKNLGGDLEQNVHQVENELLHGRSLNKNVVKDTIEFSSLAPTIESLKTISKNIISLVENVYSGDKVEQSQFNDLKLELSKTMTKLHQVVIDHYKKFQSKVKTTTSYNSKTMMLTDSSPTHAAEKEKLAKELKAKEEKLQQLQSKTVRNKIHSQLEHTWVVEEAKLMKNASASQKLKSKQKFFAEGFQRYQKRVQLQEEDISFEKQIIAKLNF